ncbi:MAG TPA: hypothetical protein VFW03_27915 [Gemmatimonadaceae bacterium]|nr:hypothetical protein [Gemmatimonadaceae bacterium]
MHADDIVVVIAAVAAIAWVNWYFFIAADRQADGRESEHRDGATRS